MKDFAVSRRLANVVIAPLLAVITSGCSEPMQQNAATPPVDAVIPTPRPANREGPFANLPDVQRAEMEEFAGGGDDEVDLRVATPTPEELRRLPRLPQLKTITIRKLKVTQQHLDVLADRCPNLEYIDCFHAIVTPGLLDPTQHLKRLKHLDIGENEFDDEALKPLRSLSLKELAIPATSVTDAGMEVVGTLSELETLHLQELPLTDAGVAKLSGLTRLRRLNLSFTEITDASLRTVAGMKELRDLFLRGTEVTDAGLAELAPLKHMDWFEAHCPGITDEGLSVIAEWPAVNTVSLWRTQITDDGLKVLGRIKTLKRLHIGLTAVTDRGLPHLYQLPLVTLNLSGTETTSEAIEKIKEAIPGLNVYKFGQLQ